MILVEKNGRKKVAFTLILSTNAHSKRSKIGQKRKNLQSNSYNRVDKCTILCYYLDRSGSHRVHRHRVRKYRQEPTGSVTHDTQINKDINKEINKENK